MTVCLVANHKWMKLVHTRTVGGFHGITTVILIDSKGIRASIFSFGQAMFDAVLCEAFLPFSPYCWFLWLFAVCSITVIRTFNYGPGYLLNFASTVNDGTLAGIWWYTSTGNFLLTLTTQDNEITPIRAAFHKSTKSSSLPFLSSVYLELKYMNASDSPPGFWIWEQRYPVWKSIK